MNNAIITHLDTPIGYLQIEGTQSGRVTHIRVLDKAPKDMLDHPLLNKAKESLVAYFAGDKTALDQLDVDVNPTAFQQTVWKTLRKIPFGKAVSYKELAMLSGHPRAVRAVGTAMNKNPLPIVIPCHRVLPSTRRVGKYALGSPAKKWLLDHEAVDYRR